MHRNTKREQLLHARAHAMRAAPTAGEAALFELLRAGRLGVVVRRQHVVGEHIVDLAIPSVKLAVEVDGRSHIGRQAADARRDRKLARLGWRVLRLEAELVLREPEVAVECVRRAVGS